MKKLYLIILILPLLGIPILIMAQLTPQEAVPLMQKGINLGNTLEPPLEGGWNNPGAQEYYFDLYKQAGFNCVRIPVRWDEHTQDASPYKIDEAWLQRVEEIIDWGLERDLFIVINAHHDNWIKENYTNAVYRARFDSIWSQVSARLSGKSEKLFFEVLNEPNGLTKVQNDEMHQRILSIIRKTNPTRIVIFQGHNWGGSDELITAAIPADDYVIGSFHSYDPYLFGLEGQGTWGSASDINTLRNKFISVKNWSDNNSIPVFLGEFGSLRSCDYNSRMKHYRAYVEFAQQYGFVYCAWDDGGDFRIMERATKKWDEVKDILLHTTANSPKNLNLKIYQDTIIQVYWTNAVSDMDSIFIEHRTANGTYSRIASLKGDTTSFYHLNPLQDMYHHYRIIAHYNSGEDFYSQPMRVLMPKYVPKVRTPYLGEPAVIPGTVEAENYDIGGEGFTYHDMDEMNLAGDYRPDEAVDIYSRNGDGYHIGNALPGEWYEYTVAVEKDGSYKVDFQLAAVQSGGTFKINIGEVESDTLTASSSNSWLTTKIVSTTMDLMSGEHIMRFTVIDDPRFNIDKIVFTLPETPTNTPTIENQPFTVFLNRNREFVFNVDKDNSVKFIQIYNITGSLVQSIQNPEINPTVSALGMPGGVYILQVLTNSGIYSAKVMVD
jgi:aryl-phospho-beta-D-glucosidase BglC (GH1 family)